MQQVKGKGFLLPCIAWTGPSHNPIYNNFFKSLKSIYTYKILVITMMMNKLKLRQLRRGGGPAAEATTLSRVAEEEEVEWEMRPGGMLVQKRSDDQKMNSDVVRRRPVVPNLRIRVAYGAFRYQIFVSSQATFGELKKTLTAESGLQPGEQRLIFRGKERENTEYLDICGVKDRSKVILVQDPESIERRFIAMRRNAKIQTAHRFIDDVVVEIDKLAEQVCSLENAIANGYKVAEIQITTLIEMLMRQAVKLDSISAEGDACEKKILQGKRVQKCVETLDVLKVSNTKIKPVIVTTNWEIFEPPSSTTNWEFFD